MGAYENPKSYTVDYSAGVKAFTETFNKGLQAGIQKGEEMIADRKAYEDSIYEQGEEMEKELQAAVDNGTQTKEQINQALEQFYSEALKVDQPTKKGLGGLFAMPKENRLDKKGLREAQNSFQSAITPINTVMDYVYTSGLDINEDEDRGAPKYKEKKAIYDAIKLGKSKPSFAYNKELGKFESYMVVNGKKYSPELLQTIFTSSSKEQREIIDAKKDDFLKSAKTRSMANLKNLITAAKAGGQTSSYEVAMDEVTRTVRNSMGLDKEAMSRNELSLANDIYNNHVDIAEEKKIEIMSNALGGKLSTDQVERILDLPMNIGPKEIQNTLGVDEKTSQEIFKQSQKGKAEIVAQYTINEIEDEGMLDQFYRTEVKKETPSAGAVKRYEVQKYSKNRTNKITQMLFNTGAITKGQMVGSETDLMVNAEFTNQFMGKVVKINDGKLKTIKGMTINKAGDIEFEYEKGEMSGEVVNPDGTTTKTKFDLKANQSYNIYNPSSQKAMYKALGGDIKGEDTGIQYDNLYEQNMASSLINNPSVFNNPKMKQWANFIGSDKSLLDNPNFSNWLLDEKNAGVVKAYPGFQKLKSISQLK